MQYIVYFAGIREVDLAELITTQPPAEVLEWLMSYCRPDLVMSMLDLFGHCFQLDFGVIDPYLYIGQSTSTVVFPHHWQSNLLDEDTRFQYQVARVQHLLLRLSRSF